MFLFQLSLAHPQLQAHRELTAPASPPEPYPILQISKPPEPPVYCYANFAILYYSGGKRPTRGLEAQSI